MKRFETLEKEHIALISEAARLVDARDAGNAEAARQLEVVRAKRAAVKAELRRRDPGYDRWEC
jgi:hypothetical protein